MPNRPKLKNEPAKQNTLDRTIALAKYLKEAGKPAGMPTFIIDCAKFAPSTGKVFIQVSGRLVVPAKQKKHEP